MNATAVAAQEVCEICATPIAQEHGHLVDMRDRRLLCACRPCYLLFVPRGAAQGRYKAVGDRCLRLQSTPFEGPRWEALQVPIGLAFFFFNSGEQRIVGFYPGPAGATESQLDLEAWDALSNDVPQLRDLQADVEALIVDRRKDAPARAYLVPIDACYELVALVRMSWQGIDGGDAARERVDAFFAGIEERCT